MECNGLIYYLAEEAARTMEQNTSNAEAQEEPSATTQPSATAEEPGSTDVPMEEMPSQAVSISSTATTEINWGELSNDTQILSSYK